MYTAPLQILSLTHFCIEHSDPKSFILHKRGLLSLRHRTNPRDKIRVYVRISWVCSVTQAEDYSDQNESMILFAVCKCSKLCVNFHESTPVGFRTSGNLL